MAKLKADVFTTAKKKVGSVDLDEAIFGAEVKEHLFYDAVALVGIMDSRQGAPADA